MELQVIENYLDKKLHEKIQELFLYNRFDWYYISPTATYFDEEGQDTGIPKDDNFMFVHCFIQEFGGEDGSTASNHSISIYGGIYEACIISNTTNFCISQPYRGVKN